jgi:hypothetical protein
MTRENMTSRTGGTRGLLTLVAIALLGLIGAATEVMAVGDAAVQKDTVSAVVTGTVTIPSPCSGSGCVATFTITDLIVHNYDNPALVVGVALNNTFGNGYSVAGITWNNNSVTDDLTRVQGLDNTAGTHRVEQWDVIGPDPSGNATGTITVSIAGPEGGTVEYVAGAISLWNVTTRGPNSCDTPLSGYEDNNPYLLISTTYLRDGLVDFLAVPGDFTASADSPQTERWNACAESCTSSDILGGGSTQPGESLTPKPYHTNFSWTLSTWTSWVYCAVDYHPYEPTLARMREFSALPTGYGTLVRWRTSYETGNLGFHLFREAADNTKVEVTPGLIAGSALFAGQGTTLASGRSYQWLDTTSGGPGRYWIEEVGLDGLTTMHGPIVPESGALVASDLSVAPSVVRNSTLLSAVGAASAPMSKAPVAARRALQSANTSLNTQWQLAAMNAARIGVREDGWYRIGKADLLAAGFDPGTDPSALALFKNGVAQALSVVPGASGSFDADGFIEFYGTGLDTPSTDTSVYWLVKDAVGGQAARRIQMADALSGKASADSYTALAERRDRTLYFAALMDPTRDNFFGPVITSQAAAQVLTLDRISASQVPAPTLAVALQGATTSAHRVGVSVNGYSVGEVDFSGITHTTATLAVDPSFLAAGANTVSLVALGGSGDVSVVDSVGVSFQRPFYANSDAVSVVAAPLQAVTVKGFTTPHVRVVDISRTDAVVELPGQVANLADGYAVTVTPLPVYPNVGAQAFAQNTLIAFTEEQAKQPAWIQANSPSQWHAAGNAADLVIIAHKNFKAAAAQLAAQRASQGIATQVIDVQDAFDEFSYGVKDPQAIRDLLAQAKATWAKVPRFVLLFGDATSDPRNYLGDLMTDFVPTKMVPLQVLKSASDDWFVDFSDTGFPQMAIGRISVQTAAEAATVVSKLIAYDATPVGAGWTRNATFISDANDPDLRVAFEDETRQIEQRVPTVLTQNEILTGNMDSTIAHRAVMAALNSGSLLVTYVGHGTDASWSTTDLINTWDATNLSNGTQLPVVATLNCLNGLFEDPSADSLGEAMLKAQAGGAVAVLASTALTDPEPQLVLGTNFYNALFGPTRLSVGQALAAAKTSDVRQSVRQSFLLLGDPSMMLRR